MAKVNWDRVRLEYETCLFTQADLGRRHNCTRQAIAHKIKKEGWEKDPSKEVQALIRAKLIELDSRYMKEFDEIEGKVAPHTQQQVATMSDEELERDRQLNIELAAETRVQVIRSHRASVRKLLAIEEMLIKELVENPQYTWIGQFQGRVITKTMGLTADTKLRAYSDLCRAMAQRQFLERQAHGIQDKEDVKPPLMLLHDPENPEGISER